MSMELVKSCDACDWFLQKALGLPCLIALSAMTGMV